MLDESHLQAYANATMQHIHDQLEQAYESGGLDDLDFDEGAGLLHVIVPSGETFLVSKHTPSRQIWLASPFTGGLHFSHDAAAQEWLLPDGRALKQVLADALAAHAGLRVVL